MELVGSLLQAALRMATPLIYAAIGETYSERAGLLNLGIEGLMLIGALTAYTIAFFYQSILLGVLGAAIIAGFFGLLFAFTTVTLKANQVIIGTALNLIGLGMTSYVHRMLFNTLAGSSGNVKVLPIIRVPILKDIPLIGPVLFEQNLLVYIALLLVPIAGFVLFKTSLGLALRAVGEHPKATATAGLSVTRLRYGAMIFAAMMAGIGGAYLPVAHANTFVENMVAGRGFIALAIVVFARWNPINVLWASLLFGFTFALQFRLQIANLRVAYQFLQILPYVVTLLTMVVLRGQTAQPKALAVPYTEQV
jgi:ABC-type uncharacterized transport system permease subunit